MTTKHEIEVKASFPNAEIRKSFRWEIWSGSLLLGSSFVSSAYAWRSAAMSIAQKKLRGTMANPRMIQIDIPAGAERDAFIRRLVASKTNEEACDLTQKVMEMYNSDSAAQPDAVEGK